MNLGNTWYFYQHVVIPVKDTIKVNVYTKGFLNIVNSIFAFEMQEKLNDINLNPRHWEKLFYTRLFIEVWSLASQLGDAAARTSGYWIFALVILLQILIS